MSLKTILSSFDRFLFSPVSPYPVAAFRVLFGLLLLQHSILIFPDLYNWYGTEALVSYRSISQNNPFVSLNLFALAPDNDAWLTTIYTVYVISVVSFILGFKSRVAAVLIYLTFVSFYHRNPYLLNSGDTFIRVISFWLVFAPTGAAWSLDHRAKVKRLGAEYSELVPAWGMRCLQIQFCCVYFHAVITKLPGWVWVNGTAVYISSRLEALMKFPLVPSPELFKISQLITWMTLVIETSLFTLIWIREFRYYVIGFGICMHLTIDWCMNIPQFEWLMVATMVLFVFPSDLHRFNTFIDAALAGKRSDASGQKPALDQSRPDF